MRVFVRRVLRALVVAGESRFMERLLGLLTLLMTVQLLVVGAVLLVLVVDERLVLVGLVVSVVWVLVVRGPVLVVRGPVPVGGSVPVGRRAVPGPRGAGAV